MALSIEEETRLLLGERIPEGGTADDTNFSSEEIDHFIAKAVGGRFVAEQAAYYGWQSKMAEAANLITVSEGNAHREATELHRNAQRMVTQFLPYVGDTPVHGKGRGRVGQMRRPGGGNGPFGAPRRR